MSDEKKQPEFEHGFQEACELVGLSARTITAWDERRHAKKLIAPRGRPALRASAADREIVEVLCESMGGRVGVPRLQAALPAVPRREIAALAAEQRSWAEREIRILTWHKPGRVWAMDFTEPAVPIDNRYRYVLAVRDLASGYQLASMPCPAPTAEASRQVLELLFVEFCPPLVLKSDNGSAFMALRNEGFFERWRVQLLLSPVRRPAYNGSCEAGIGGLKTRTLYVAAAHGRLSRWTSDDLEAARVLGNETPRWLGGPSATDRWTRRSAITTHERELFAWLLERHRAADQDATERRVTRQAMEDVGIVSIRRRRIAPSINSRFWTRIP